MQNLVRVNTRCDNMRWREFQKVEHPVIPFAYVYDTEYDYFENGDVWIWQVGKYFTKDIENRDGIPFIKKSGYYQIIFNCSFQPTSTGDATFVESTLVTSTDGSNWNELEGTSSYSCLMEGKEDKRKSIQITHVAYINANTYLTVKFITDDKHRTQSHGIRMMIKFVPTRGWNNNHAGKINYRGGILR